MNCGKLLGVVGNVCRPAVLVNSLSNLRMLGMPLVELRVDLLASTEFEETSLVRLGLGKVESTLL